MAVSYKCDGLLHPSITSSSLSFISLPHITLCNHSFSYWFWSCEPFSKERYSIHRFPQLNFFVCAGVPSISTGWPHVIMAGLCCWSINISVLMGNSHWENLAASSWPTTRVNWKINWVNHIWGQEGWEGAGWPALGRDVKLPQFSFQLSNTCQGFDYVHQQQKFLRETGLTHCHQFGCWCYCWISLESEITASKQCSFPAICCRKEPSH